MSEGIPYEQSIEEPVTELSIGDSPIAESHDENENIELVMEEPVVTEVPVTEEPVTEVPVTEVPVTEEPVTEEPVMEDQVVTEVPVTEVSIEDSLIAESHDENENIELVMEDQVVTEVPVTEVPVTEVPVTEVPVTEVPVTEVPVTEEPVMEEPVTEEPVTEVSIEDSPIAESHDENENIELVMEEPVTEVPVTEEPVMEELVTEEPVTEVPKLVFIVPYRDRESHYKIFSSAMKEVLANSPPYQIFYLHQCDTRGFNRGAMKNIGFLAVKNMYPNDYQNITLVFNDIDTMPAKDTVLNYQTTRGIIKHFYGFDYTLGGIVSINAGDFERLNGFPNLWAWGYEDNLLQTRAKNAGIIIDRSVFYKIFDSHIVHLMDTPIRTVNRSEFDRFLQNTPEGINSIKNLNYKVNDETGFIDVLQFNTTVEEVIEKRTEYDLRNGPAPFKEFIARNRRAPRMKMHF